MGAIQNAESSPRLAAWTRVNSLLTGPTTLFWMAPMRCSMQYFPVNQKSENRSTILLGNGRFAQSRVRFGPQIDGRLVQDAPVVRPNTQCQDEQSCNPLRAWLGRRLL